MAMVVVAAMAAWQRMGWMRWQGAVVAEMEAALCRALFLSSV